MRRQGSENTFLTFSSALDTRREARTAARFVLLTQTTTVFLLCLLEIIHF